MSDHDDTLSDTETVQEVRKKAPWTKQFRQATLVLLGGAAFLLFLYFMYQKSTGANIAYEDLFLLLATSGTLLGINFSLDVVGVFVDAARDKERQEQQQQQQRDRGPPGGRDR